MRRQSEVGFIFLAAAFCCLFAQFQCQSLTDPIRNTLGLWSRLLNRMAQRDPPTDEQLHFKVTPDELPSFRPLFRPIDSFNLSPTSPAHEPSGKPGIINEEILYHLLPPVKGQTPKKTLNKESTNIPTKERETTAVPTTVKNAPKKRKKKSKKSKNPTPQNTTDGPKPTTITVTQEVLIPNESLDTIVAAETSTTLPITAPSNNCTRLDSCSSGSAVTSQDPMMRDSKDQRIEGINERQESSFTVVQWMPEENTETATTSSDIVNSTAPTDEHSPFMHAGTASENESSQEVSQAITKEAVKKTDKVVTAAISNHTEFAPDIRVHFRVRSQKKTRNAEENSSGVAASDVKVALFEETARLTKGFVKVEKTESASNITDIGTNSSSAEKIKTNGTTNVNGDCKNGTFCDELPQCKNAMPVNAFFVQCNDSVADECEFMSNRAQETTNTTQPERSSQCETEELLSRIIKTASMANDSDKREGPGSSNEQADSEQSIEDEAGDTGDNSVTGLSQLDKPAESETRNSKSETNSSSGIGSTLSMIKSEIPDAEEDDSATEHGSPRLNLAVQKQEVTTSTVLMPSASQMVYSLQATARSNSNPAQNNAFTPVNSIIDGIGPLILPLLGYTYDARNGYYPYVKRNHGATTFADNHVGEFGVKNFQLLTGVASF
ncbi:unnamed protein product [Toxocara canis]|uniref:Protein kinase domain-containing protein n=1 Tax=Toxocara canis TaxID=6265 RepID=A0A183TV61_TOXCA|nr:unnamed protein product [Toxocara canis]